MFEGIKIEHIVKLNIFSLSVIIDFLHKMNRLCIKIEFSLPYKLGIDTLKINLAAVKLTVLYV